MTPEECLSSDTLLAMRMGKYSCYDDGIFESFVFLDNISIEVRRKLWAMDDRTLEDYILDNWSYIYETEWPWRK